VGITRSPVVEASSADSLVGRIRLKPTSRAPLHAQLADALRTLIRQGHLGQSAELPGELELAMTLGVSRHTVRHALGALVSEGWLRRQRGARTVVASERRAEPVMERRLGRLYAFAWELEARGQEPYSRLLARSTIPADARLAQLLEVELGSPLDRIQRLRMAGDEPMTLDMSILPASLTAGFDQESLERESIYDLLERHSGVAIARARETLRPVVLDRRAAELLEVPPGSAAFAVERVSRTDQRPVEWQHSLIRGDRYLYSVDLVEGQGLGRPPPA
jgi:GntR family transcriptional regulator